MQRSREFILLSLVSLYLLMGLSLTNIGLSSVNHAEPVQSLMLEGFLVWLIFTLALFLLHFYLSLRLQFSGDQLILPLIAILCATSLILISYLEPTRLQSAVEGYNGYSPQADAVKLYKPKSYIEIGEFQKMVESWNLVTVRNTTVLAQNKVYCEALTKDEYDWERCPVIIGTPDWHWYLNQQLGMILIGFATIALFLRKPKREGYTRKWWRLEWPVNPDHIPTATLKLVILAATVFAYFTVDKNIPLLFFFSITQLAGFVMMWLVVIPLFQERWLELSGIQAVLLAATGLLFVCVLLHILGSPIWMAEWVRILLIVFFASVGGRFLPRLLSLQTAQSLYWQRLPYVIMGAVLFIAVVGMLLLNDFGAVLIFTFISFSFIILLLQPTHKKFALILMVSGMIVGGYIAYILSPKICDRVNLWLEPNQKPREGDICQPMVGSPFNNPVAQDKTTAISLTNVLTGTGQISPTLAITNSLSTGEKKPPLEEPVGTYQIRQMIRATWYGTVMGQGLGQGRSGFIPAAETDLMFAVLIEQMGWIGGLLIVAVYIAIVWRGFMIAQRKIDNPRHALLAAGLAALLGFHALTIIGGTVLVLPFTGITVPFLSRGNLSMMLSFITIGLMLRISEGPTQNAPDIANDDWINPGRILLSNIKTLRIVVMMAFFFVVTVGMARISIVGPVMASIHSGDNQWANAADQYIQRGAILDRDGNPIVVSTEVGSRVYPDPLLAESLAPLIGHDAGYAPTLGIEYFYNDLLKGYDSSSAISQLWWYIRVNALHQVKGNDVKTTISAPLQKAVYQIMIDPANVKGAGAAIVIDSRTGEILADVSVPSFDVVNFTHSAIQDNDPTEPFLNRALQGTYPPGSVFKIVTMAAALDTSTRRQQDGKAYDPQLLFDFRLVSRGGSWWHDGNCPGVTTRSYQGYGRFYLNEAFAFSDNVVFAQMGQDVPEVLYENFLKRFGLTTATVSGTASLPFAIGMPSSASTYGPEGFLSDSCKRAVTAFGQGDLQLTPLQVALIGATIANDGKMPYPKLITAPAINGGADVQVMKPETAKEIQQMMLLVVNHNDGSGFNARICSAGVGEACKATWTHNDAPDFTRPIQITPTIAGKTGTAEIGNGLDPDAWFVGFSPDNPRYVVAVVLEHQGSGAEIAAPVAREILKAALNLP